MARDGAKCSNACNYCRGRKVKCDGGVPCRNCLVHNQECVYAPSQRGKKGRQSSAVEDRLARMEAVLQSSRVMCESNSSENPSNVLQDEQRSIDMREGFPTPQSSVPVYPIQESYSTPLWTSRSKEHAREFLVDKEESVLSPQKVNWEHHGPGSWLSVCSRPGLRWVSEQTGEPGFTEIARGLTVSWTQRLKIDRMPRGVSCPDLEPAIAWDYTQAYFEESFESVFGVIYRPEFEARLRSHFEQRVPVDDDIAWYALRNTVYAAGCRVVLSKSPSTSFVDAQAQAWRYFQNALAVYSDLLFTPTALSAVQALAAMTFYVEGLGSPALEYMMCASAARLAQSQGLHRQPSKTWNLPETEILKHNWLFWAIYCCEKQIAQRSGRPSAIDDDDISCQIPVKAAPGSTINVEVFTHIIKHAQVSSQISRNLMSVKAFHQTPATLMETANLLNVQLQQWKESLPTFLEPCLPFKSTPLPPNVQRLHVILVHYAYYGSLMAIHTIFAYPWILAIVGSDQSQAIREQELLSSNIIADAARNIIRTTRYCEIDAAKPQWSGFYYPMVGLINLFIYVLKFPTLPSVQLDVALLDAAAGHFGHLEFVTSSELAFPFTREVAALARNTVKKSKERIINATVHNDGGLNGQLDVGSNSLLEAAAFNTSDFDMESWSIFSPVFMDGLATDRDTVYF